MPASVGNRSTAWTISSLTRPAGTWPKKHEGNADATFPRGEILAAPWPGLAVPRLDEFRPVVARKDHDGVVADAEPVHGIEHLADIVIHLGEHVRPVAVAGLAAKAGFGSVGRCGCVRVA